MVHFPFSADDGFAETEIRVENYFVEIAADRVDAEADARDVALDHLLHHDGHRRKRVVEALLMAIRDRAVEPERQEARLDLLEDLFRAGTIQIRLVLSGERRACEVFHGGGRTHGER